MEGSRRGNKAIPQESGRHNCLSASMSIGEPRLKPLWNTSMTAQEAQNSIYKNGTMCSGMTGFAQSILQSTV